MSDSAGATQQNSEFMEEAPDWAVELYQDLETRRNTVAECTHERSAYMDAAQLVVDHWSADYE